MLVFTYIISIKAVFQSEWVSYLELLPCHDSCCTNFVWLNSEFAIFVVKHVCLLSENSWKESNNCPAQETSIGGCVASVEEGVPLLWVSMQVTEDPDRPLVFLLNRSHEILHGTYLWMKLWFWINPLPIQINPSKRISIIAANDTIRIHARYKDESVKTPQEFGFSLIRCKEVEYTFECETSWRLTRVHSCRYQDDLILFHASLISCNDNLE